MPRTPCLGCGRLVRGSRCSRCKPRRFNKPKRGSGWQASRFRERVLAQTGGRCAVCGLADRVEAHHLGPTDADGGVPLCWAHHAEATRAERRAQ